MYAVVGLGNPGARYERTRHNAGAWVLERLAAGGGADWQTKFDARISRLELGREPCLLVFPQSYMNRSGGPVRAALEFYKIDAERLIVCHDELDLPPGGLRVKFGGSTAGHQGLNDIKRVLGTADFYRVRLGIGRPPGERDSGGDAVSSWVLGRPSAADAELLQEAVVRGAEAVHCLIEEGLEAAQRKYNRAQQPQPPS